ncbi:unnamed protein product [Haemonchus placei]|uniref:Rho-GAP domain-containing protein n=1 Tax=Haemonchus placei TaxID=6290 RepID=A0A0N4WWP3_HAEPC|nr:unnamed protein product [Haemonchus placei]
MAAVIPMMVVPSQNPLFIGSGGSKRELKNQSDKNIAFRVSFIISMFLHNIRRLCRSQNSH